MLTLQFSKPSRRNYNIHSDSRVSGTTENELKNIKVQESIFTDIEEKYLTRDK
jgi:hypothetical protein